MKKVGKTTRPFRYDLNQILYVCRVEVSGSDRVPDKLWTEVHDVVQETGIKTISKKKKMLKGKMVG